MIANVSCFRFINLMLIEIGFIKKPIKETKKAKKAKKGKKNKHHEAVRQKKLGHILLDCSAVKQGLACRTTTTISYVLVQTARSRSLAS